MKLSTEPGAVRCESAASTLSLNRLKSDSLTILRPRVRAFRRKARVNKWLALAIILVGPFLGVIDFFIANIGVPSIRQALGASYSEIELVIAGYGLAYAVCLVTGGRLGDIFLRTDTFAFGMACFAHSSAFCWLAPTAGWRLAGR